jgi:hypothetical protein
MKPIQPKSLTESAETHQRFRRLRLLILDPRRCQRLIFEFSLLSLVIVILGFGIEFYLRDLALHAPTQQDGLVGALDQATKNQK